MKTADIVTHYMYTNSMRTHTHTHTHTLHMHCYYSSTNVACNNNLTCFQLNIHTHQQNYINYVINILVSMAVLDQESELSNFMYTPNTINNRTHTNCTITILYAASH